MGVCPKCGSVEVEMLFPKNLAVVYCKCRKCGFNGPVEELVADEYELFNKKLKKKR